jgi:thiamine biosynthesis protein ThiS
MIEVKINGEAKQIPADLSLTELLKHLNMPNDRLAVELNEEVVRKINWDSIKINGADKIEIVHFVGGG